MGTARTAPDSATEPVTPSGPETAGRPAGSEGPFCTRAWAATRELVEAVVSHPFNVSLADGDLPRETFTHYLAQDSAYLEGFARALSAASVLAPCAADAAMWSAAARDTLLVERALHDRWLVDSPGIEVSPTSLAYTSWLEARALRGPYEVLTAALLPCFWVYEHVGGALLARCGDLASHPYRDWLEAYGSEDYSNLVDAARDATERAAARASSSSIAAMHGAFVRATEYEWLFWDAAWRRETWPTAQWRSR